jgi:DNA-binding response OmpR family regulator
MRPAAEVKVLIVEDDPYFTRILHKRLSAEGYQVFSAQDGRAGMKAIVQHEPDLVLSDWMMPEVDGLELCQSVKTGLREAAPYFILLTAKGEVNDKLLALETGADDYLVKPCDQVELLARVRAGIRIVSLTQTLRRNLAEARRGAAASAAAAASASSAPAGAPAGASPANASPATVPGPIRVCRSCHRVAGPDGRWMEPEVFLRTNLQTPIETASCGECRESEPGKGAAAA